MSRYNLRKSSNASRHHFSVASEDREPEPKKLKFEPEDDSSDSETSRDEEDSEQKDQSSEELSRDEQDQESNDSASPDLPTQEDLEFIVDDEYDPEKEEKADYFDVDAQPIKDAIFHKLKRKKLDIGEDDLKRAINRSFKKAGADMLNDYLGAKPSDKRWKIGLDKKTIKELEPQLKEIRASIDELTPTMEKILKAKLPDTDKRKAVELFDMLQNCEPFTEDYFGFRNRINRIIKSVSITDADIRRMNIQEVELEKQKTSDISIKQKILNLDIDEKTKTSIYAIYLQMQEAGIDDSTYSILKDKIDWAIALPHQKTKDVFSDIVSKGDYLKKVRGLLDEKLYGMDAVKNELIMFLNNRLTNPKAPCSLALKGKPGVGKTRIVQVFAEAIGLPFDKISCGGFEDPSILKGKDQHWKGASPSIFLHMLRRMKCCNGIVLIDEIDKLGQSPRVQYALLDITDYTQNNEFRDLFLTEYPHNLSMLWFIFSMNTDANLVTPLRDRLHIIEVPEYTNDELKHIGQNFSLVEVLKEVGMKKGDITIATEGIDLLFSTLEEEIKKTSNRPIRRALFDVVSKINLYRNIEPEMLRGMNIGFEIRNFSLPITINRDLMEVLLPKPVKEKMSDSLKLMYGR
jgi:ATP-dependent Lon protease